MNYIWKPELLCLHLCRPLCYSRDLGIEMLIWQECDWPVCKEISREGILIGSYLLNVNACAYIIVKPGFNEKGIAPVEGILSFSVFFEGENACYQSDSLGPRVSESGDFDVYNNSVTVEAVFVEIWLVHVVIYRFGPREFLSSSVGHLSANRTPRASLWTTEQWASAPILLLLAYGCLYCLAHMISINIYVPRVGLHQMKSRRSTV